MSATAVADPSRTAAELQRRLDELAAELRARTTERDEALAQQAAMAEILQAINGSPTDLGPVFQAIADSAARLCNALNSSVYRFDGELIHFLAESKFSPQAIAMTRRLFPAPPSRDNATARAVADGAVIHIPDVLEDPDYRSREWAKAIGLRSVLSVPMFREGRPIGVITVNRAQAGPFPPGQVELLKTFADQAVIAIENARLLGELRTRTRDLEEALEYQTATSDVLKVISGAAFDLEPVLQTVVTTAMRLCRADQAVLYRNVDGEYRWAAGASLVPEYERIEREVRIRPGTGTLVGRAAREARTVHILDAWTDPLYEAKADARVGGAHTMLGVPLLREGEPIGVIGLARQRVEPYAEKEIELVRTFADQAVIAIENTRLLTELRESLEQQQAIAEVLQVINRSPGDLAPVFEAILEKAHSLCGAATGTLQIYDGEHFRAVATRGLPEELAERLRRPHRASRGELRTRLIAGEPIAHAADLAEIDDPAARAAVERGGVRTSLFVALRKDGALLGAISAGRKEVRPFSEKEIALFENFAAQAAIAMENARLLHEIRQRQAELRVTFDNMGDGVAMFDAELRLTAWNRNFQQMLDLPDSFLAARPSFAEYFRYLAERGEYTSPDLEAELRRAIADPGAALRFERTRPDGRVIEVRRNAVPGGGFVLIYGDITERKRAEAEIHRAREAAEKALAELRATQQQLIVQQKMAALGQLTAGIAHEIKNPLNFVNNFAGLSVELLDELKAAAAPALVALDDDIRAEIDETIDLLTGNLDKIAEHGKRADGIVQSMLAHSRGTSGERQPADLNALVEEALNLAYHGARAQDQSFNITLERDFDGAAAPIELVPQDMMRVFLNLIGNGFYAATKRAREAGDGFRPVLGVTTRDLGDAVAVAVRDNGTGILPEHRDRLFQPFFTTKPTGEGTGLGLSISYDIVTQQHGGTITVDSEPGTFTEFTVRLPRR